MVLVLEVFVVHKESYRTFMEFCGICSQKQAAIHNNYIVYTMR